MATNPLNRPLTVFVSSTSEDLLEHRAVARLAIADLGWAPAMMEHMGPQATPTLQACFDLLDRSELVVLLVAFRQGTVAPRELGGNGVDSYTALELARAREKGIPVLAFLASDDWPARLVDMDPAKHAWVEDFRKKIQGQQPVAWFKPEERVDREETRFPLFRSMVRSALQDHAGKLVREGTGGGAGIDFSEKARRALASGRCIPLLGGGVYGAGPLSAPELVKSFRLAAQEPSFVAASEWAEDLLDRNPFLDGLCAALEQQEHAVSPPAVHDLLLSVTPPPLVVSTTHDLVFERRLEAAGRPFVLVTHVLRTGDGRDAGSVALFRSLTDRKAVELCPADAIGDKIRTASGELPWVVYKPVGAPTLHRLFDDDRGIDTVVASETDHMTLLDLLQTKATGVPSAFSRPIQKNPFVFLGYPLDTWNYRLLFHVLQSVGVVKGEASRANPTKKSIGVAVRVPESKLEELAWQRLLVDLVRKDPNEFARESGLIK